jgi:ABC-type multidrug transport system fused ATPase/permease subunit
MHGQVAYASQVPWIVNATLQDNVRLAAPDRGDEFYGKLLKACCLFEDLERLPAGDQTEIGERGINLSGGQRARVSVARAAYRDVGLYLFDDPLAAVDAHVAKSLFDQVFGPQGMLAGKTRILVTHQVQFLQQADTIVVVQDGCIEASGSFEELTSNGLDLAQMERQMSGQKSEDGNEEQDAEKKEGPTMETMKTSRTNDGTLVQKEEAQEGSVKLATYKDFIRRGVTIPVTCFICIAALSNVVFKILLDFWLAWWTDEGDPLGLSIGGCITVFAGLLLLQGFAVYFRSIANAAYGCVGASRNLYRLIFRSVFGSPVVFFDMTPTGQLLNRFTADIDILDNQLPRCIGQSLGCMETYLSIIVGMIIVNPLVVVIVFPCCFAY